MNIASERDYIPSHLYGKTQYKTLHARLCEDILAFRDRSLFIRTAPGKFFLRAPAAGLTTFPIYKEFTTAPRRKQLKPEPILSVSESSVSDALDESGMISPSVLSSLLSTGCATYEYWNTLKSSATLIPVSSFVTIYRDDLILSYEIGRYISSPDKLVGKRSVGFGGPVFISDLDFLYDSFFGIIENGVNELSTSLGLPKRLAERARYSGQVRPMFATISGPSRSALQVVLAYECPATFFPTTAALSFRDLRWLPLGNPGNDPTAFDYTSQLLFRVARAKLLGE
jgi:hypothetical protein